MVRLANAIIILTCVISTGVSQYSKHPGPHKGQYKGIQRKIVMYHNMFRQRVIPPATNMLRMRWHKDAAKRAQKWAHKCAFLTHNDVLERWDDSFGACGQNIYISTRRDPWFKVVKAWNTEKYNFTYGSTKNHLKVIGHYTQVVWATTHRVGCAMAKCHRDSISGRKFSFFNYVCDYCPAGNIKGQIGYPYKRGHSCTDCPNHCFKKMCTNTCPASDLWSNCGEIYKTWPKWLCHTGTEDGRLRHKNCKATCTCENMIY